MTRSRGLGSLLASLVGTLAVLYLVVGLAYWAVRTVVEVMGDPVCREKVEAASVDQVLGFDNSGLTRIIAWGPSLYQAVVRHGFSFKEFFLPAQCASKGSISLASTRCSCQITPRSDNPALQRQLTICGTTFHFWAKPDQTCQAARPAICCPDRR